MKRIVLFLLLAITIVFMITACLKGEREKTRIAGNVKLVLEGDRVRLYSLSGVYGMELTFSGDIPEESFIYSDQFLMIHRNHGESTCVALAKMKEQIMEGENFLTVEGLKSLGGLTKVESEQYEESATPPLPDGICVVDKTIPPGNDGFFYVHGKGLSNVGGIAVTINYDSTYFTVDTTQGNNGVTILGTCGTGLNIVTNGAGKVEISTAFMSAKNIAAEDMYKVHVTTKTKVGESNVVIAGEVRDPNTNLIQTTFTGGKVKVGEECKLLGDFNNDCTVNLQDFIVFAQHYNSVSGDTRYGVLYDIHPAEMGTGAWAGIYCKATPDGQIKLGDFIVFANNYGKQCPTPPTNPTISGYVRDPDNDNMPVAGVTMNFSGIGTTTTNTNGYYSKQVTSGWTGTVTPSKSGYTFTPPSRSYNNVINDMSNENYQGCPQPEGETGGFKVANSWGIGGWENVPDGFLYITYEAMKQNKVLCFVVDPKDNYEPRAIAVFKISHPVRDDCYVYVGVGNPSSPSREKRFDDYIQRSGPYPYPDNKMVLDITELLPFNNETLYLKVYDTKTGSTGTIEFFSVEIYDNYPSGVPSSVFISTQTPKNTVNNSYVNVQIPGVTVSAVSNYDLSSNTGGLSKRLLEGMKETMGVYEEGRDYNEIINGYGTGLRPPSAEEWEEIANSWYEMKPFGLQETLPVSLDHSSSVHFPPIGNQGSEGSCVAFSVGYYTATFYEARDRSWDLSGAQWVGGYYGAPTVSYQDRILSPDFIYHQINKGSASAGSAYQDAIKLISNTGVSSWKEMPYDPKDSKTWPSESAWREAPRYRSHTNVMRVLRVENDQDIQTLKSYINAGYLVSISVDAYKYNYLTANDVWNSNNYTYPNTNHANTIVGYDDLLCGDL